VENVSLRVNELAMNVSRTQSYCLAMMSHDTLIKNTGIVFF